MFLLKQKKRYYQYSLNEKFNCNIGYSGHENGIIISVVASMYNITSLERHITLDKTMYGSDQAASIEFSEMKKLVELISKVQLARGENKIGEILDEEIPIAKKLRKHIKI